MVFAVDVYTSMIFAVDGYTSMVFAVDGCTSMVFAVDGYTSMVFAVDGYTSMVFPLFLPRSTTSVTSSLFPLITVKTFPNWSQLLRKEFAPTGANSSFKR